jgi:glutathione synthase/RimK-type ligase-like ATP-grasp enzyme
MVNFFGQHKHNNKECDEDPNSKRILHHAPEQGSHLFITQTYLETISIILGRLPVARLVD